MTNTSQPTVKTDFLPRLSGEQIPSVRFESDIERSKVPLQTTFAMKTSDKEKLWSISTQNGRAKVFRNNVPLKGSCVLKASVNRVSVDTLGRYVDRQSPDMSTDSRPIYRPILGRHVGRDSVDTHVGRHPPILHRHSADTRPILYRHWASTTLIWTALVTEFYLLYSTVR